MKFPAYWARFNGARYRDPDVPEEIHCWGWSDTSQADAEAEAVARAKRMAEALARGEELPQYPYGRAPLREEVIQRIPNPAGEPTAAITQNAYGAMILNADRVMFLDLDFAPQSLAEAGKGFFSRLFGHEAPSHEEKQEAELLERVRRFHSAHPEFGLRAYRTRNGVRVLVTHDLFDPCAKETRSLMQSIGVDPVYIQLCEGQQCFRARLTPKPWRCGFYQNPYSWPHEDEERREQSRSWQQEYEDHASGYATCRFVDTYGTHAIHPEVQTILGLHDKLTRCEEDLPLA